MTDVCFAKYLKIFLVLVCGFLTNNIYASHAVGIDLSYTCLGNNRYEVTLNFYRDCKGQGAPGTGSYSDPSIDIVGCGVNKSSRLDLISSSQVPAICPGQLNQTSCDGGSLPGVEQYVYKGVITVPANCSNLTISYRLCCRNSAITNLVSGKYMYEEAVINNSNNYCNNSPVFTTLPVPYICAGEATNYNHGAVDIDGDALVYSLVDPLDNSNTPIAHINGTSATNPLNTVGPFQFDSNTG